MEKHRPGVVERAFLTHPPTSDRVRKLHKELTTILPPQNLYVVSTSEFDDVVAHLLALGNSVRPVTEVPRPTLQRRSPQAEPSIPEPNLTQVLLRN